MLNYIPYAIILAALYLLLPMLFRSTSKDIYSIFLYDVIFPGTTVICAVHYSWKHGLDFIFAVISPILYLPSMLIYNRSDPNGFIFLMIYLVCGILGTFIGDIVYSEERRKKEKEKRDNDTVAIHLDKDQNALLIEEDEAE